MAQKRRRTPRELKLAAHYGTVLMIPMTIADVAGALEADCVQASPDGGIRRVPPDDALVVRRVTTDSREVRPGDLFFALRGQNCHGHEFMADAFARGAVGCVCESTERLSAVHPSLATREVESAEIPVHDRHSFKDNSPDSAIDSRHPVGLVVPDSLAALARLAGYYRRNVMLSSTVVVAVTGSNGKTTTKHMLHHVLLAALPGKAAPKSFNNHVGVPLTLLSADADDRFLIVEIGTNAPGEVAALAAITRPDVAVITSIGEAHLEGLGGIEGVLREKLSLLDHLRPGGLAVVNVDRAELRAALDRQRLADAKTNGQPGARLLTFGRHPSAQLRISDADEKGEAAPGNSARREQVVGQVLAPAGIAAELTVFSTVFHLDGRFRVELPLPGLHHAGNAAAAFAVARWFGLAPERMIESLRFLPPQPGRTRVIELDGITVVDDSYNANPASLIGAIESLSRLPARRRVLVMGDMLELGEASLRLHRSVVRAAAESGVELLVTVGPLSTAAVEAELLRVCPVTEASSRAGSARSDEPKVSGCPRSEPGSDEGLTARGSGSVPQVVCCNDTAEASDKVLSLLSAGDLVWIKGSRRLALERIVNALEAHWRKARIQV